MKKIALTLIVAGAAFATEASSQTAVRASNVPPGQRPPAGMCRIWVDGVSPGRQPRATDCATARANAPANSRIIYGNDTPFPGRAAGRFRDGNCEFERRPSNLGDTFFGVRTSQRDMDQNCRVGSNRTRDNNVWYPVGRDANGNVIYERRARTSDGRTITERARSRDGRSLSRIASNGKNRANRDRNDDDDNDDRNISKSERDRVKALEKAQRDREKALRKAERDREKAIERARRDADRNARGNNGKRRNGRDG